METVQATKRRRPNSDPGVTRRSDGRWQGTIDLGYRDGKRHRKFVYGKTQAETLTKLRQAQRQAQAGVVTDDRVTVEAFLSRWLSDIMPGSVTGSTLDNYHDMVRVHLVPGLGKKQLSKLTVADVNALWAAKREAGYKPNSIRIMRSVLRRALAHAESEDLISRNVAARSLAPKIGQAEGRALSVEQAHALLDAAKGDRLEVCYLLMVTYGLRRGEALGLTWDGLDLANGTLAVRQAVKRRRRQPGASETVLEISEVKTQRSRRTLYLTPEIIDELRAHRARGAEERLAAGPLWTDHGLIFPSELGTPMDPDNFAHRFIKLCDTAGLGRWHLHELRHSAASLMLAQGTPLEVVSETLGHSGISITKDVYGHLVEGAKRDAAQRMTAVLTRR